MFYIIIFRPCIKYNKLTHPPVAFNVFLVVADDDMSVVALAKVDIVFVSRDEACHVMQLFCQNYKRVG